MKRLALLVVPAVACSLALGALCVVQALVVIAPYFGARMPRCAR